MTEGPQRDPQRLTISGFTSPPSRVIKNNKRLRMAPDEELTAMGDHPGAKRELKRRYGDQTPDEYWNR